MRLGVCGRKFPGAAQLGPERLLDRVLELGFDGVFFRSVLDLDPQLDPDHLRAIRRHADGLGLYLEAGLGKVNPFNTSELPAIRSLGAGDYRLGMEKMIRGAHAIGCKELWADTANSQHPSWGLRAIDRFRTDVSWPEQLQATRNFLRVLAPLLRDLGCRINLETHEEITTHELVAMIEAIGSDVLGSTLDLANVVIRGEDPVAATRRMAPYVHLTHIRDVVLYFIPEGIARQIRPCGDGVVDWKKVISLLAEHHPELNLSVENVRNSNHDPIHVYEPEWQASHPEMSIQEVLQLVRHAYQTGERMRNGDMPGPHSYYHGDVLSADDQVEFIRRSHAHLRHVLAHSQVTD